MDVRSNAGRLTWRLVSGALVATLFAGCAQTKSSSSSARSPFPADSDLAVMLHYLVEDGATPGIAFGIVEADGGTRILSAGTGGPGTRPLGPESAFELGSITKTFTGTLLALAVRRGEVSLDDPVADHLPDSLRVPSWNGREITLLDLATHRSGLPRQPSNYLPGDLGDPYAAYTLEVLYDFLATYELRREPGSETEYSNLGFGLVGHALARVAGMPYTELVRARILDPLGMDDTGYALDGEWAESMARPHSHGEVVAVWTGTEAIYGAGGLRSTMEDMLKYLAANVGPPETELERAMRDAQQARVPFDPRPAEGSRIGLAWRIIPAGPTGDGVIVEHAGGTAGSSARIAFDPDRGVGFVRLANTGDFPDDLGRFPDDLGVYMLQTGPPIDRPVVDLPREVLERRVGAYRYAPDADLYIRLEDDGWLTSQLGPTVRFRLYPDSDTTVYLKRIPTTLVFRTAASGEVEAVALGPRKQVLPKVSEETPDPHLPTAEILDRPLSPQEIARYEGSYVLESEDGRTIELRVYGEEDRLAGKVVVGQGFAGGARIRFRYQGDHTFVPERDPAGRVVFTILEGRASGVEVDLPGTVATGRRDGGA